MFKKVAELFGNQNIYVIPTFQRPYSWDISQWEDLKSDITTVSMKTSPYHYFAPIHVVQISNPNNAYWKSYTDIANDDISTLTNSDFRDDYGQALNVYLVIDGQQRLTTLYSLIFNSTPSNPNLFCTISGKTVPRVILNPSDDHLFFRNILRLTAYDSTPPVTSKSQERLANLFGFFSSSGKSLFPIDSREYKFLTSNNCQFLLVQLPAEAKLAAFMTLNDRGKDLTTLEKSKSLLMELDENYSAPTGSNPAAINTAYGQTYVSIEKKQSYLNDNEMIRQIAMALWEGKSLPYSITALDSTHKETESTIYEKIFKNLYKANGIGAYIHNNIIPAICHIVDAHDYLVDKTNQALTSIPLGVPSFTDYSGIFPHKRDAIEDYYTILQSLKLQSKQLGFLMAVRNSFNIELHDIIRDYQVSNQWIKDELLSVFDKLQQDISKLDCHSLSNLAEQTKIEINSIPSNITLKITPLKLAELLRLIVDNSKPGTFSTVWNDTFNVKCELSFCVDQWMAYIFSWESRNRFILDIAQTTGADNQSPWVRYILKEYEYCLSGWNAHRHSSELEIEHFFGIWNSISSHADLFTNQIVYENDFRDRIGNKLVLSSDLNRSIKGLTPMNKTGKPYSEGSHGNTNCRPTASSNEIAKDLSNISDMNVYRFYVLLRSIRLAVFAAKRF